MHHPLSIGALVGHAICIDSARAFKDESWICDFPGEATYYFSHVLAFADAFRQGKFDFAVFSGGFTHAAAGVRSEAESYCDVARYWSYGTLDTNRVWHEEGAHDSFENFLFVLGLSRLRSGRWPSRVTFFGWSFKEERFELHRQALRWPSDRYEYVGLNNPPAGEGLEKALAGERAKCTATRSDPYLRGAPWQLRRQQRNWRNLPNPYQATVTELGPFFSYLNSSSPDDGQFSNRFPWESCD